MFECVDEHSTTKELEHAKMYTVPSLRQLQTMPDEELRRVKDFTVGHKRHGQITFTGLTDVRRMNLTSIVELTQASVTVYPPHEDGPTTNAPPPIPPRKTKAALAVDTHAQLSTAAINALTPRAKNAVGNLRSDV